MKILKMIIMVEDITSVGVKAVPGHKNNKIDKYKKA